MELVGSRTIAGYMLGHHDHLGGLSHLWKFTDPVDIRLPSKIELYTAGSLDIWHANEGAILGTSQYTLDVDETHPFASPISNSSKEPLSVRR